MSKAILGFLCVLVVAAAAGAASLEEGFAKPPREARPLAWWHWINGNVTKEGITADLEDMKRVGMGGAQLFDTSLYHPAGPVRYGTDGWHEHVRFAMQEAERLGLEFGSMNCPGWSMSGGPWVTVEKSMKMFTWSETAVDGGKAWKGKLTRPRAAQDFYRDALVVAVPAEPVDAGASPAITCDVAGVKLDALSDGKAETLVRFAKEVKTVAITLAYPQAVRRRLMTIDIAPEDSLMKYSGSIQVSEDGKRFRTVRQFAENSQLAGALNVPFEPVKGTHFRLVLRGEAGKRPWPLRLAELRFSDRPRVGNLDAKVGMAELQGEPRAAGVREVEDAIRAQDVIDLTGKCDAEGNLQWDAPPGKWVVIRFGYTTTGATNHPAVPEGHGLEVDKFDVAATEFHFEQALGRIIREAGPKLGRTFTNILSDSWEAGPQNWTPAMPTEFRQRNGYEIASMLPCLTGRVVGSMAETEAFLCDFRNTHGELYARHYATLRRLAKRHGIQLYSEAYGGSLDEFRAAEELDVPMAEFWMHMQSLSCRRSSSAAHTMGKVIVAAEAFTARPPDGRWGEYPAALKPVGDAAFVEGINRFCLHSYVHQPRTELAPGFTHSRYGTHFGRLNTWWPQAGPWMEYVSRCQYLLQQGRCVGDVLFYRNDDQEFTSSSMKDYPEVPAGYRWDIIAVRQLMQARAGKGTIRLANGATYRALVMPGAWTASVATLRQVEALADGGAVVVGGAPISPVGLVDVRERAAEWKEIAARLEKKMRAKAVGEALASAGVVPDFAWRSDAPAEVKFIHRRTADAEIYFVSNQAGKRVAGEAEFRVAGRRPEIWDASSGRIRAATSFAAEGQRVRVPLTLDAAEAVFVVFREALPKRWIAKVTREGAAVFNGLAGGDATAIVVDRGGTYGVEYSDGQRKAVEVAALPAAVGVAGPWRVEFPARRGAPESISLNKLMLLNTHENAGVRHFSGVATYRASIDLPATLGSDLRCVLRLGEVHDLAEVRVNGQLAGIAWTAPFEVDVTALVRGGRNELAIAVANRWVNRLIGDESLPADAKYATDGSKFTVGRLAEFPVWWNDAAYIRSRQRIGFPTWKHFEKDSPLVESGLVGPVEMVFRRVVSVKP